MRRQIYPETAAAESVGILVTATDPGRIGAMASRREAVAFVTATFALLAAALTRT